jgi:4a-hydroxytetrahydrobiopterin dehydratase
MPYAEVLSDAEVEAALGRLTDWRRGDGVIERTVTSRGFRRAIELVNRVAELAIAANHHPDISVHGYRHVTFRLTTHAAGGITRRDVDLAAQIDAVAGDLAGPGARSEEAGRD